MKCARFLAAGLCALALLPSAALAGDQAKPDEKVERRVVVRPGAEPQIMTWTSEDGDGLPRKIQFGLLGRGYLGVQLTELTPELRQHFGAPEENGVLIGHVEHGSPADKAGLRVGDVLTLVDDAKIESSWDVTAAVRPKKDGETVGLEVVRGGRVQTFTATLAEREREQVDVMPMVLGKMKPGEGLEAFEIEGLPALAPAMKRLEVMLDSPEMKERMDRVKVRNLELEKKLEEMEKRLQELEKRVKDGSK
jgi:membrane-associated protease RseP (regulator of RpoE activity)